MLTNLITFDAEYRAICRYICDKYAAKENTSLMGSAEGGLAQRAAIDQWLEVESQSFNPPSSTLVAQLIFFPQMKLKQDAAAIRESERKLKKVHDVYEHRLSECRFLAGDEFSLADLSHLPNAHCLVTATDRAQLFTSKKNAGRWREEISGWASWKKVLEMHKPPSAC